MANQMANYLKQQGIQKGDKVAVLGYRNNTAIIGIMGILKLGAVFVPLDPGVPEQRTKYIRENSEWKYLLDTKKENEWKNFSNEYEMISIDSNSLAYIIYTSGSTGQPKGVMISNAAAVNTILDINKKFNITSNDKIAGISSLCFDLSIYDIFGTFAAGASLVIIENQRNMQDVMNCIEKNKVTVWNSVPAIMDMGIRYINNSKNTDYIWEQNSYEYVVNNKKMYWSPAAVWKIKDNTLYVNKKAFNDPFIVKLLPELYFFVQEGKSKQEILDEFSDLSANRLEEYINQFIDDHILVDSILTPEELFGTQDNLFQHTFGQRLIYDAEAYQKFKNVQMRRHLEYSGESTKLPRDFKYPDVIKNRKSTRVFNEKEKIPFNTFSAAISVFAKTGRVLEYLMKKKKFHSIHFQQLYLCLHKEMRMEKKNITIQVQVACIQLIYS
ncbi:hypothetical protein DXC31_19280, partial [Mediterraneibacter gnavus]